METPFHVYHRRHAHISDVGMHAQKGPGISFPSSETVLLLMLVFGGRKISMTYARCLFIATLLCVCARDEQVVAATLSRFVVEWLRI